MKKRRWRHMNWWAWGIREKDGKRNRPSFTNNLQKDIEKWFEAVNKSGQKKKWEMRPIYKDIGPVFTMYYTLYSLSVRWGRTALDQISFLNHVRWPLYVSVYVQYRSSFALFSTNLFAVLTWIKPTFHKSKFVLYADHSKTMCRFIEYWSRSTRGPIYRRHLFAKMELYTRLLRVNDREAVRPKLCPPFSSLSDVYVVLDGFISNAQ